MTEQLEALATEAETFIRDQTRQTKKRVSIYAVDGYFTAKGVDIEDAHAALRLLKERGVIGCYKKQTHSSGRGYETYDLKSEPVFVPRPPR